MKYSMLIGKLLAKLTLLNQVLMWFIAIEFHRCFVWANLLNYITRTYDRFYHMGGKEVISSLLNGRRDVGTSEHVVCSNSMEVETLPGWQYPNLN